MALLTQIIGHTMPRSHGPSALQDMRRRGLGDPLLLVSDGAAGNVKAIETCFPRSARQRCLAQRQFGVQGGHLLAWQRADSLQFLWVKRQR